MKFDLKILVTGKTNSHFSHIRKFAKECVWTKDNERDKKDKIT